MVLFRRTKDPVSPGLRRQSEDPAHRLAIEVLGSRINLDGGALLAIAPDVVFEGSSDLDAEFDLPPVVIAPGESVADTPAVDTPAGVEPTTDPDPGSIPVDAGPGDNEVVADPLAEVTGLDVLTGGLAANPPGIPEAVPTPGGPVVVAFQPDEINPFRLEDEVAQADRSRPLHGVGLVEGDSPAPSAARFTADGNLGPDAHSSLAGDSATTAEPRVAEGVTEWARGEIGFEEPASSTVTFMPMGVDGPVQGGSAAYLLANPGEDQESLLAWSARPVSGWLLAVQGLGVGLVAMASRPAEPRSPTASRPRPLSINEID
jgi:hypothetical protein